MKCPSFPILLLLFVALIVRFDESPLAAQDSTASPPAGLENPRATMRTFLESVNDHQYEQAVACLDWSDKPYSFEEKQQSVRRLKDVIDRMAWIDYAKISDQSAGEMYKYPPGAQQAYVTMVRAKDGGWRFTAEPINELFEYWKDKPRIVSENPPWYRHMTPIGNEYWRIVVLFMSILCSWIAGQVARLFFQRVAVSLEKRQRHYAAVTLRALAFGIVPVVLVFGLRIGLGFLILNTVVQEAVETFWSVLFATAVGYAVWCLADVINEWLSGLAARTTSKLDDMLAPMIRTSLRVTIVILVLVQVATIVSNKPMTSVIAGLGVGGLAIGLAAQDMIKNFFGSIMIFSDRPFELGDRIQVEDFDGVVETVGFRSTRLRTLDGHLVTMPNGELANMSIRNVAKRPNIRRILNLGVTYDTSAEKLQQAIEIVEDVLRDHEGQDPELPARVFFNEFNDSSLNLFVIYWYHPADWWAYCAFSQQVNLEIYQRFNKANIEFAFPSQTIYLAGEEASETESPALG